MGLSESHIRALRSSISSCLPGQHIGRSTTLRLALHKADVQQECDSAPLTAWAATIWDGTMSDEDLADAWYWQSQKVGMHQVKDKPSKWSRVTGPAGACILTARRIGWTWPAFNVFVDRSGRHINLRNVCPQDVRAMVLLDSDAALWDKWTKQPQWASLAPRPCIEPLVSLCKSSKELKTTQKAVEHIVAMGAVTQTTLQKWGYVDSGLCQACQANGTPHHRFWKCPAWRSLRLSGDRQHQHAGAKADENDLLYTRCLVAEKKFPFSLHKKWCTGSLDPSKQPSSRI